MAKDEIEVSVQIDMEELEKAIKDVNEHIVMIVRCKECKYYDLRDGRCFNRHSSSRERMCTPDWFCADGERKEGR